MSAQEELKNEILTFVIPSRNNAEFLRLAYNSIRSLETTHHILVLDDLSADETTDLIVGWNMTDEMFNSYLNPGKERLGVVGLFDIGIGMAKTDYIVAFHADMVCSPNFDKNILKHIGRKKVVCATRVEPPLHPSGPEKITEDLGVDADVFDPEKCREKLLEFEVANENKVTHGIFAPWCCNKHDYLELGGHDKLFAPQSKEDSDLFNRMKLSDFELIQSWDALVYHFTCRGSRFNKHSGGGIGIDSEEWKQTNEKSYNNFIRKWGRPVMHDEFMMPIVKMKYDIGLKCKYLNLFSLKSIEPYVTTIYTETDCTEYCKTQQQYTDYDLFAKFKPYNSNKITNDILVEYSPKNYMDDQLLILIPALPHSLDEINEIGTYQFYGGELTLHINYLQGHEYDNLKK